MIKGLIGILARCSEATCQRQSLFGVEGARSGFEGRGSENSPLFLRGVRGDRHIPTRASYYLKLLSRYAELIAYFPISKLPQGLNFPASGCVINFAWVLIREVDFGDNELFTL